MSRCNAWGCLYGEPVQSSELSTLWTSLVVTVSLNTKLPQDCIEGGNKAKRMLGFMDRNFRFKVREVIMI